MAPSRIQVPDNVFRISVPGSRKTIFTTKRSEERIRLDSEDRKAKLAIRAHRRAKAESNFYKDLEKTEGAAAVAEFLLRKLAVQENISKGFSREIENRKEQLKDSTEENLERAKQETAEALKMLSP